MNTEEKANAYDEALKLMKGYVPDKNGLVHICPYSIFPELEESKDEKIIKCLITLLQHFCKGYRLPGINVLPVSYKDMLTWLEEQSEKKSAQNYVYIVYCRDENGDYFCGNIIAPNKKECIKIFRKNIGNYKFTATRLFKTSLSSGIAPLDSKKNEPIERFIISEGKYT